MARKRKQKKGRHIEQSSWRARLLLSLFFLPFLIGGIAIAYVFFIKPTLEISSMEHRKRNNATVLQCYQKYDDEDPEITYLYMSYAYSYNSQNYENDRYELAPVRANIGSNSIAKIMKNYPSNTAIQVWVNPDDPQQSIVHKDIQTKNWFALLFSVPFLVAGIRGTGFALLSKPE